MREALTSLGPMRVFGSLLERSWVVLHDLKESSTTIAALRSDVESLVISGDQLCIPRAILVPRTDLVVRQIKLTGDPDFVVIESCTHSSIAQVTCHLDLRYIQLTANLL